MIKVPAVIVYQFLGEGTKNRKESRADDGMTFH
jgi:hypothetical protein